MKRKLKTDEESEEIIENEAKPKKVKNDESEVEEDTEILESDIDFNIKQFRQNLKVGNFYDDLKLFIKKAAKSQEIIRAFTESGGKPLEIVEIIKNNEDSSLEVVSNLYHMLRLLIFYIINDENIRIESTVQALKFLVNGNKISIDKMLSSSKSSDKVLMLKILSIATSLDTEIGRDILKNIDVFAKATEKDDFSMLEDNKKKKTPYEDSVRLAFVHFILGFFFNDKDVILRKKILQKRSLFEFFLRDLHLDNFETVKSVLTCLTKNVLISTAFNKPEKLKIFTDNAIKSVLKLYEWKGEEAEKSSVLNITHQFLLLLLTSKKHGIVFKALSEKRQNLRQLQVITMFKNVWNYEYPSMLVIEIVKSCPDLMQTLLARLVMGLQPKVTTSWFMCANFTKSLITTLEPSTMINSFSMLEPKKISANIIKLSISQFILQNLNERALIQQDNLEIRETSVELLHLMMDRCCKFLDEVGKIPTLKDFEKHRIKFDIINHIFTFYPNIDIILNSLYRSINLSAKKKSESLVKSQLKHTLEILLLIIKNFPSIIEKIPSVIDYLEVLRPIYEYQLSGSEDVEKDENLEIEMKVVKIILFLQPSILSLESEMFQRIFLVLIQVYCCSLNDEYKKEAKLLLMGILNNTMIFQSGDSLEVSVWLAAFESVKRGVLKESAATFVKVLRSLKSSEGENLKWSTQEIRKCDQSLLELIDADDQATSSLESKQLGLSLVLPGLLSIKSNKINRIIEFVEISTILLYHSHPHLKKSFLELLEKDDVELNTKIVSYIKKKSLTDFGETLDLYSDLVYRKFQQAMINGDKVELNVSDVQQLELLIIQAIFCAIKLDKCGKFEDDKVDLLIWYIQDLYNKLLTAEKSDDSLTQHNVFEKTQMESEGKKVNKICELNIHRPSVNVVNYIFKHQSLLLEVFSIAQPNQITKFIAKLPDIFKFRQNDFEISSNRFRTKIVGELLEMLGNGKIQDDIFQVIEKFALDEKNCVSIIEAVVKQKGTIKEFHIKLLERMIERLTELKTTSLSKKLMQKIEKVYVNAAENTAIDMSGLETILLEYLTIFTHNIGDLTNKMFQLVFKDDQSATKSFVRLISNIFSRNDGWNEMFKTDVMKAKKELMYPLLNIALNKGILASDQLKPIYQEFKSGIIKAIEKPNKAAQIYRENVQTSVKLIELAMPLNECQDLAMKKFKFEASEIYQLRMLQAIFTKAYNANQESKIYSNFMNHWLHLFALSVEKKSIVNEEYLEVLDGWLKTKPTELEASDEVNEKTWETFYRMSLKNGLKSADGSKMLILLGKVVRSMNVNPEVVTTIFDMILTHSNFFHAVCNFKTSGHELKRNLFFLLNVLVQKNPAVAHEKHIPIFLSAYQATMTSTDQLILNLLRFYELKCEIDFYDYRPFLFGPTALGHFSSNDDQELKLMKKNVDDMNIVYVKLMNTFEKSMVENTVNNYPITRQLAGVPADNLEQFLIDKPDAENIYDPGYFLPVFEMIFVTSSFNFMSVAVKNNLISLILPALSCEDENMRLLAAHILMRCRETNETKKGTKEIWLRFYDSLQHGFSEISEGTKVEGKTKERHFPRAASISTQLLAQFVNILPNELHPIYNIVANYLVIRPKFDFSTIPELLVMFHSSDVQQLDQRLFILEAIHNGIKDDLDFKLLNNTPLLKMIFSCYGCPLSERKLDLMIIKIVNRIVTKTSKVELLIQRNGLALWIFQVAVKVEAFEYDAIEMILNLIEHSFDAIRREVKDGDDESLKRLLMSLLVILPKFTKTRLSASAFISFLRTVNGIAQFKIIAEDQRNLIIDLMKMFLPENFLRQINYIDEHPEATKFMEPKEIFSKSVEQLSIDDVTKTILVESREFIMKTVK